MYIRSVSPTALDICICSVSSHRNRNALNWYSRNCSQRGAPMITLTLLFLSGRRKSKYLFGLVEAKKVDWGFR